MSVSSVRFWRASEIIPTYEPAPADKNPMFFEKRVYQGSSGRVYPLPVTERVAERKTDRAWDAVYLENDYLRVMLLPEIGGRIHEARDKLRGYELIYRQRVIKPALVGLAGAWASGGIEFNWPQHHRPSTFMPCDVHIEEHADGAITVWMSEHDPMLRMKGMHGVCLHPDRAVIELKVRAYNRTPSTQTFLWWANVATHVHEAYQSFFPPDVHHVADHAKRSVSTYPLCAGRYYGVDYAARARDGVPSGERPAQFVPANQLPAGERGDRPVYAVNDLSWYANIPVPTSYMCMGSEQDFFGGYDHRAGVGLIHFANHHISPGKKQWTWGNQRFGYAWDRNLTDEDGPYIELMAGVYTDNQPDFSFLQPGETKDWSQYWYPIHDIGTAHEANLEAALSLRISKDEAICGVSVTRPQPGAVLRLEGRGRVIGEFRPDLAPGRPHIGTVRLPPRVRAADLHLSLVSASGSVIASYVPREPAGGAVPPPATEPAAPQDIAGNDELFVTGLHLDQYRHATRMPEPYWREALRRDSGDSRCHNALGCWHLRRGEFVDAEHHFRAALDRLTRRNPNPADGEPSYNLGLALRHQGRDGEAYAAFYKATWNQAWQGPGFHALAEIDCARGEWSRAVDHLDRSLRCGVDNLRARDLRVIVLRRLGRTAEADECLEETLRLDPLDWWARALRGDELACDVQVRLDLALDHVRAGLCREALTLLEGVKPAPRDGTAPLVCYYRAWLNHLIGDNAAGRRHLAEGAKASPDYCFPARVEEIAILRHAIDHNPNDARAPYFLGNLLYDRRRHREAVELWESAIRLDPTYSVAWRNLGLAQFNALAAPAKAQRAYERALAASPGDARVFYERDQLWKRTGRSPAVRLREMEGRRDIVARRDDLTVEHCTLLNLVGRHAEALALLESRRFQPWEGGEGLVFGQYVRTRLALGREALAAGNAVAALGHFEEALVPPDTLGEARHLLVNPNDIHYWCGRALEALGDRKAAKAAWEVAAQHKGDLQGKAVAAFSDKTFFSALALRRLGQRGVAAKLLRDMRAYAHRMAEARASIDYFATSLPSMMLFEDDLQARQENTARFLEAVARLGLGEKAAARRGLAAVLRRDPSHQLAREFYREPGLMTEAP
jgi:tetratricopeptide (TPR) repeat protein